MTTTQDQAPASIYDAAIAAITTINQEKQLGMTEDEIKVAAKHLQGLNDALASDRTVCLVCHKKTSWKNLDHYSLYYVDAKGRLTKLWLYQLTRYLGGSENTEASGLPAWTWTAYQYASEATDGLRIFMNKIGGNTLMLGELAVL